ncbi:MAG: tetratricopeptide repeat protein, partial [Candidatus Kapaibacterium sp.]
VEGLVRKRGDVDFVSVRIFDLKKGGEMWEQFYQGNIKELFNTREKVCEDVFNCLRDISNNEQELQVLEKNVQDHPDNAAANAALAKALIGNDNIRSLYFYQKAIKADSTNESYYINAGIVADRLKENIAHELGREGAAIAAKKLKAHPDSTDLATTYCIALDVSGQMAISGHLYDSLMRIYPTQVRLFFNAACNFSRQGEAEKAIDVLEKLRSFAPGKLRETRSDPDFDNIRMYPRYVKLMAGVTNP